MTNVAVACAVFAASVIVSERFTTHKLQSALGRVLIVHLAGLLIATALVRTVDPAVLAVFWFGSLAGWIGVRSHLESSILLQMLHALDRGATTREQVLARCLEEYGPTARIDELVRGGFLARTPRGVTPSRKGRLAARAALFFR